MASSTWLDFLKSKGVNTTSSTQQTQSLKQPDYGVPGALAGLYGAYTQGNAMSGAYGAGADQAAQQANTLQSQMASMPTLDSLYGQNSPYSQQLQQTLAAKDAAAGRNSQYGQRAIQLQATLADKASQYGGAQAQMANQYNQAMQQAQTAHQQATLNQQQVRAQQLGSLFNVDNKTGLSDKIGGGLQGLYSGWTGGPAQNQPMADSPYGGGGNYSGYTTGQEPATPDYQSNQGMGQMYGSNNTVPQNTSVSPTDSSNQYWMDQQL